MPLKKDDALAYPESIIYFFTRCFFLVLFFSTLHPDIPALIREAVRDEQLVATGLLWLTLRTGSRHETVIPGRIAVIYWENVLYVSERQTHNLHLHFRISAIAGFPASPRAVWANWRWFPSHSTAFIYREPQSYRCRVPFVPSTLQPSKVVLPSKRLIYVSFSCCYVTGLLSSSSRIGMRILCFVLFSTVLWNGTQQIRSVPYMGAPTKGIVGRSNHKDANTWPTWPNTWPIGTWRARQPRLNCVTYSRKRFFREAAQPCLLLRSTSCFADSLLLCPRT